MKASLEAVPKDGLPIGTPHATIETQGVATHFSHSHLETSIEHVTHPGGHYLDYYLSALSVSQVTATDLKIGYM